MAPRLDRRRNRTASPTTPRAGRQPRLATSNLRSSRRRPISRRMDPFASPEPLIRRVYAYAAYRLGDGPAAEDVTSQTFERALRYRDSFDGRRGDVVGWLIGIARRCIVDAAPTDVPIAVVPEAT